MSLKTGFFSVLKTKEFLLFVIARFLITFATQVMAVIVGWQIFKLTNDPLSLGLIGLAEAFPFILISLYAGHVADIMNRKRIIQITVFGLLICALLLAFLSMDAASGIIATSTFPFYLIIFLSGIARGFFAPANFAFMPQLIQREMYPEAISWSSTAWQTGAVTGPSLSGIIFALIGFKYTYLFMAFVAFLSLILYSMIAAKPVPPPNAEQSMNEKIREGLKFVFSNQVILGALSLDLFAVLFGGAVALLPIFARDILKVGAEGLGFLRAAPAVGAIAMALFLAYKPIERNAGKKLLLSVAAFGACMIVFAISKSFLLSFAALLFSGVFDSVSVIVRSTLIHTLTPENMKGRVSAVNSIFIGSSNEIGAFESGLAARLMRTIPSVIFGGCMTILVVSITAAKAKQLIRLQLNWKEKNE